MTDGDGIPELPQPWVFDGYRRLWEGGRMTSMWQARAVNPLSLEEEPDGRFKADWMSGAGSSMQDALEALLDILKAPKED